MIHVKKDVNIVQMKKHVKNVMKSTSYIKVTALLHAPVEHMLLDVNAGNVLQIVNGVRANLNVENAIMDFI